LGRRSGIGALDAEQISDLIANGKLLFPFLNNQRLTTSEEDNISFKDLKLDEFLKQIGRKANDSHSNVAQTMFSQTVQQQQQQQQHPPVHIQEYNTTDDEKLSLQSSKEHPKYDNGGRISKNSGKSSVKSRRSVRNANSSTRRHRKNSHRSSSNKALRREEKKDKEKEKECNDVGTNISTSSLGSDLGQLAMGLRSSSQSANAISMDKMNNSHGSKRSCDVGIQANAHEIATMTSYEYELNEKNLKNEENEDIYMTESHSLLPKHQQKVMIAKKRLSITESEKLKLLLLPSK
jgi:smoothened